MFSYCLCPQFGAFFFFSFFFSPVRRRRCEVLEDTLVDFSHVVDCEPCTMCESTVY